MHDKLKTFSRRKIPAVHRVLDVVGHYDLPRPLIIDVIRRELSRLRAHAQTPEFASIVDLVRGAIEQLRASRLQPIINGTGIVIHTNFGRAPLDPEAIRALRQIGPAYSNLEYDLISGERGHRASYIEKALALLCGCESATIVNNCAAALLLIVRHFVRTKSEVVISRGEMIQIGGGFRIGEIIEAAGAKLREIGATNKTTLDDYAKAIGPETALILKVHRSNFFMSGFVASPASTDIAVLARKKRIQFVEDLGSGAIAATEQFGIAEHEPTPAEALKNGADLICFSGDKLFGGPQAGIIAGKKRLVSALKREPLFRALRCDKLTFAVLQTTVDLHLNQSTPKIPGLALFGISNGELRVRAEAIAGQLQGLPAQIAIGRGKGKAGGGTLPKSEMPSVTIDILPGNCSVAEFAARLRVSTPPVIGYITNELFKLDLRTIFPEQDGIVVDAIRTACATHH
ncbi:MAG TPA: L-seryl-tRNA(Sec) selenium transferase [Candidatus Udaeobacter sp.]|jgi:L-seryl-tRNA(Ser) seleniumtransferase